jgi:transcriptional regulator with XRE-family HTH domain
MNIDTPRPSRPSIPRTPSAPSTRSGSVARTVGARLRHERELLGMSLEEVARATRIPAPSLERIESDRFDDLPGEVFVHDFLKSYARTVGLDADEVLAQYSAARRVPYVAPMPVAPGAQGREGRRVGIAIAFVLLLVLCTMALSFVLRPRGRDVPGEVSVGTPHGATHSLARG